MMDLTRGLDLNQRNPLFNIGSRPLKRIYDYLPLTVLCRLKSTCRRFHCSINHYVTDLQILVDDEYGAHHLSNISSNHVVLEDTSPDLMLYPNPPFTKIRKLFLNFNGDSCGKINLVLLDCLTSLKIRGPSIVLSSNKLPSVRDVDLEDVACCERQIFPNLRNFFVEFDCEELSQVYNSTESKAIERAFIKALDILCGKRFINHVKFTISLAMELLAFEKFVDSVETFLKDYELYIDEGKIDIIFKHPGNYFDVIKESLAEVGENEDGGREIFGIKRRFDSAFERLKKLLPQRYHNLEVKIEEIQNIAAY